MKLAGKVALITGASSGIGAGTAELFASLGCKLCLTGRNSQNLDKVIENLIADVVHQAVNICSYVLLSEVNSISAKSNPF
ncbi:hypothetical protein TNCT_311781 [Trichonephila clavata]|uniref:Uncharacterized protein n=1 Tax=Trichonephila clavata TaxID=2740835 RepID=A0A8X6GZE1_TRICU|nr:hypothetical protein TNCT_311781 [Trichonephila clavata]